MDKTKSKGTGMKKLNLKHILLAVIMVFAVCFGALCPITAQTTKTVSAEDQQLSEDLLSQASSIVTYCNITQSDGTEGVVIAKENFSQQVVPFATTDPDGTITGTDPQLVNVLYLVGSVNITPIVDDNGEYTYPITVTKTTYSLPNFTPTSETTTISFIRGDDTDDIVKLGATIGGDVFTQITIETNYTDIEAINYSFTFYIFQAKNINYDNFGINWYRILNSDPDRNENDIIRPGENQTYSDIIRLKLDFSSIKLNRNINKLYVDFWHNGKAYSLRFEYKLNTSSEETAGDDTEKYELKVYNNFNDKLDFGKTEDGEITSLFGISSSNNTATLTFSESGSYKVRIYDNTYNGSKPSSYNDNIKGSRIYPLANIIEYNFNLTNTDANHQGGFYCTATTTTPKTDELGNEISGEYNVNFIVSEVNYNPNTETRPDIERQRVNRAVTLNFYNLSNNVASIVNTSYHIESSGDVISQQTVYDSSSGVNNLSIVLEDEASYNIRITFNDGSVKLIMFQILRSVRSVYEFDGITYPLPEHNIQTNIVTSYDLTQRYTATNNIQNLVTYNGIYGYVESNFRLNIARSAPSITGISNNQRTTSAVNLTLTGVATQEAGMRVTVYRNGSVILNTTIYNQDETRPLTYTLNYGSGDLGNYTVQLTDAMNNTTQLSFSITQQQNAAGIILIIIACALGVLAIVFIIRVRSKVSVR